MAHYEEVKVRGYEEFCQAVSQRSGKDIFAYFSGDKDAQGQSWCPDCVKGNLMRFSVEMCTFTVGVYFWSKIKLLLSVQLL